jgi:DnaJ like chaperone protein
VLGCSPGDSDEEIRRRYRKLLSRYHPDRFIAMELDEEFVQLASGKVQRIRQAYEEIARRRGFRPR